jgi:hypothetical protein
MATELEIIKREFLSNSYNYAKTSKIAIEDSQFLTFTELLDEAEVINTPVLSRAKDIYKNGSWSILGYSCNSYQNNEDDIEYFDEDEAAELESLKQLSFNWEYSLFNGFFSGTNKDVSKASKHEINKSINEVVHFIEKTFSKSLINDISEARNLQDQLLSEINKNALDRIDIYIVTDSVIDQDNLDTSVYIKNFDLTCRIYYWDLKKWNDLKRSKSKRLPININFKDRDYEIYDIKFIEKKISNKLAYYLAFFPGNLISDIYDINKTKVLESNVRVFLSTKKPTNKEIRKTIKESPNNFFSYNNGISATAESVIIENEKIILIKDFQIVNGGQTTATIHHSSKIDKYSLDNVFVAVKITALKKDEEYGKMVNRISLAANTQTAPSKSDFVSNHPYLTSIERLSVKNPVFTDFDKTIYYFFERMNGQFNVTMSSKGNERQQKAWLENHPKIFMYNKIDIARWYNMMFEFPHIAASGAENQFGSFINDKLFQKPEITLGRYKTLIGFGLLFQRIYKLCGTAKGRAYPSLTIDPVSGSHSPVALSTAIYSMSLIHIFTEGKLDYWSIYNFQHGVCESLISKDRIDSKFDRLLEKIIISVWNKIAKYGGAAAQEKTKKKECWDFVKNNIKISNEILENFKLFEISDKEKEKRNSVVIDDVDKSYFDSLNVLLNNNAQIIQIMSRISNNQSNFLKERVVLSNMIKKINSKEQILTKKKVDECILFYNKLVLEGFLFDEKIEFNDIEIKFSINDIFNEVFNNKKDFLTKFENSILENELDFDKNELLFIEISEIIEKFDREYGLSIDDFHKLNEVCIDFIIEK